MTEFVPTFPLYFDSSMLSVFKSCERKFFLEYIHHWKPKEASVHLHAGGAFAKGMEVARRAFYAGELVQGLVSVSMPIDAPSVKSLRWETSACQPGDSELAIAAGLDALMKFYGDYQHPSDSAKSLERMLGAFEYYFSVYPLTWDEEPIELPGGKRAIEFSFSEPTPVLHPETGDPILIVGKMDAILKFAGGKFITDEKTTTQLGASWSRQWDLRGQFSGYAWGCSRNGIHVDGALVRGVSILKTKYDTQQVPTYRPEWQVDRWFTEACTWIEDAIRAWKKGYFRHNLDHTCAEYGGCGFRLACTSQDPESWIETAYERRIWNPLAREETKI